MIMNKKYMSFIAGFFTGFIVALILVLIIAITAKLYLNNENSLTLTNLSLCMKTSMSQLKFLIIAVFDF